MLFKGTLSKNYAFEVEVFKFYSWNRNIIFFNPRLEFDFNGDHTPKVEFDFVVMNTVLLYFSIYNINHKE